MSHHAFCYCEYEWRKIEVVRSEIFGRPRSEALGLDLNPVCRQSFLVSLLLLIISSVILSMGGAS